MIEVAGLADIPKNEPYGVAVANVPLVLVRTDSQVVAYQGRCPHEGALLAEGKLEAGNLVCNKHQWKFRLEDGQKVGTPPACLQRFVLEVEGGMVRISPADLGKLRVAAASEEELEEASVHIEDLPGPKGIPVLGNALKVTPSNLHLDLEAWADEFGGLYMLNMGVAGQILIVSDPEIGIEMMKRRPEGFRRLAPIEKVFKDLYAHGVFSAEGEEWRMMRKAAAKGLNQATLIRFYPKLLEVVERLKHRMERNAASGATLNMPDEIMRYTVDVTTNMTMGYDMNTLEQSGETLQDHLTLAFPTILNRTLSPVPYWRYVKLPKDVKIDRSMKVVVSRIKEFITVARHKMQQTPELYDAPEDFLQYMLAEDKKGAIYSEEQLVGQIFTMLLGGEDTTAYTLTWTIFYLIQNEEYLARARAEIDAALGDGDLLDRTTALPFLEAAVHEAMRLRPVAPLIHLTANVDQQVGRLWVPEGTDILYLNRQAALQNDNFYAAREFRPERWLEEMSHVANNRTDIVTSFGGGSRYCPGRNLAIHMLKAGGAMLLKNFDFELVTAPEDIKEVLTLGMGPDRIHMRVKVREPQVV